MRSCLLLSPLLLALCPASAWAEPSEAAPQVAVVPVGPRAGLQDEALTANCRAWAAVTAVREDKMSRVGAAVPSAEANLLAEAKPLARGALARPGVEAPPQ